LNEVVESVKDVTVIIIKKGLNVSHVEQVLLHAINKALTANTLAISQRDNRPIVLLNEILIIFIERSKTLEQHRVDGTL